MELVFHLTGIYLKITIQKKWIVAGGLSVKNVKKAIEITGAPIVDISSGVEEKKE